VANATRNRHESCGRAGRPAGPRAVSVGQLQPLSKSTRALQFRWIIAALMLLTACTSSSGTSAAPVETPPAATSEAPETTQTPTVAEPPDVTSEPEPTPTATPAPTLADNDVSSVNTVQAGAQIEDSQGNVVAVYGVQQWPEPFEALSDAVQEQFAFFGQAAVLNDPTRNIFALDVGMCSAGIDAAGEGTAEFFLQASPDDALSTVLDGNRELGLQHPIQQPAFQLPSTAECSRGWLPMMWSGDDAPELARYVLAFRPEGGSIERHVYQWQIDRGTRSESVEDEQADDRTADVEQFAAGQTVTFNQGELSGTTVRVDGWAELVGVASMFDGTRQVAVSVQLCPVADGVPDFGLGVDGWNMIAPTDDGSLLGPQDETAPAPECYEDWLEFSVPFGAEPTSFFASDGERVDIGYAEWSLQRAALPAPQ